MKCPHCGIEIRDTMTVCMYCGGKIPQRKGTSLPPSGKAPEIGVRGAQKSPAAAKHPTGAGDDAAEEEEGSFAAYLQPGEQVLIGSLNVSVKKFFFHAYLTNQRIFLIDTQEKKLKVTAKDIPLSEVSGCIVETSESSDPVLVVSTRTGDDEVKTMKIVFTGNGIDRAEEIDEWVELLNEQIQPKKPRKTAPKRHVPEPEEEPEIPQEEGEAEEEEREEAPVQPQKPKSARQEIRPAKKPVKDHERQPPVKRLHPAYEPPAEEEMEDLPPRQKPAPRYAETGEKGLTSAPAREIPSRVPAEKPVKKVEVQSAMKGALKGAVSPVKPPAEKPAGRTVAVRRSVQVRPEPISLEEAEADLEPSREEPVHEEEEAAGPVFCQNCGKKLPAAANFCPGCGAKITPHREKPAPRSPAKGVKKAEPEEPESPEPQAEKPEEPRPVKPPAKKVPKGSEMTILHKFLRR